jgi:uncharacterized protein (UPF0264 family)
MRVLVSVRDVAEALAAASAGADFIDLKDPASGALGGLPVARIGAIVAALRAAHPRLRISATIGDVASSQVDEIVRRVAAVAACGVDDVKVGIVPGTDAPALLAALAACDAPVVPVLLADAGIDMALVESALAHDAFAALMLDTADKGAGSLLQRLPQAVLQGFVARLRSAACLSGLAGSLRLGDLPALRLLSPGFAGFRSAVCAGSRDSALDAQRVHTLCQGLREPLASPLV